MSKDQVKLHYHDYRLESLINDGKLLEVLKFHQSTTFISGELSGNTVSGELKEWCDC